MKRLILLSLLALAWTLSLGSLSAADKAAEAKATLSRTFNTVHFTVHYDPSDPYLARIMARGAEEHIVRIARDLGCRLEKNRPFPLFIYPNHMRFIHAGGLEERRFTVGTAASDETISVDVSGVFEPADTVMAHEITHAVIFRILGRQAVRLPLWANEGLAQHESLDSTQQARTAVIDAAAGDSLVPLSNLSNSFPEGRTDLAYAESFLAVRYLVDTYGKSTPRKILAELAKGGSFDDALRKTTGLAATDFETRWYKTTTAKFWTVRFSRIAGAVGSALMACLVVIAFAVRRKQKIEAAKQWDREQFEETLRRQLNDWHR